MSPTENHYLDQVCKKLMVKPSDIFDHAEHDNDIVVVLFNGQKHTFAKNELDDQSSDETPHRGRPRLNESDPS